MSLCKRIGLLGFICALHTMLPAPGNAVAAWQRPISSAEECRLAPVRDELKLKLKRREAGEVRGVTRLFIDAMFGARKSRAAVERYFQPQPWSQVENEMLDRSGYESAAEFPAQDAATFARRFAVEWNFEDQWVRLALGTSPLWRDGISFDTTGEAQEAVLREREQRLKTQQLYIQRLSRLDGCAGQRQCG